MYTHLIPIVRQSELPDGPFEVQMRNCWRRSLWKNKALHVIHQN